MFADIDTIKSLLQSTELAIPNIYNERLVLNGYESSQLAHTSIDEDSESVKVLQQNEPVADSGNPLTLNAGTAVSLDYQKLAWNSVVVASDLALTTVYTENYDYVIDYFNGLITLADPAGSLATGTAVYVWYIPYTVMTNDDDYSINYAEGLITRRAGTSIPENGTVYVDYSHAQATVTDNAIYEAMRQSDDFILARLKSGYDISSPDEGLRSAANNYALYVLCQSLAVKELKTAPKDQSDDIAQQLRLLGEKYESLAMSQFSKFIKITPLDYGGLIKNRFVTKRRRSHQSPTLSTRQRRF